MKIQNLLLPKIGFCTKDEMFFRKEKNHEREVEFIAADHAIKFSLHGTCEFNTYFNGLSVEKWKKYTIVKDFILRLSLKGKFLVTLTNFEYISNNFKPDAGNIKENNNAGNDKEEKHYSETIIDENIVESDDVKEFSFPYKLYQYKGMISFRLKALEENSYFYGGQYEGEVDDSLLKDTEIAINICTFRRESYLLKNIDILKKEIIDNIYSPLYNKLHVFISDNGRTLPLDILNNDFIHTVPNKNVGGAGGFTRGLIEIMKKNHQNRITHVIMMDDDVVIEPEAIYRTYFLLRARKDSYDDLFIGGAMLRIDRPNIQVESGASWNEGKLISNKQNYNLSLIDDCLMNEVEEYTEFNAWWYCCMPTNVITPNNLPLPIFIRGDDLEYGLRNMKHLALMNGICVWHEAFENKYSSFLQYYIVRNLLYDNAIHCPDFGLLDVLRHLYKNVARELIYYRYKNVDLIYRGVRDFLKGVSFLEQSDGEKLHKEIMDAGYKALKQENLFNASFRINQYYESLTEQDSKFHKMLRLISINGYLLPSRKRDNNMVKVVSMSQCRPVNFYRQKHILNYDVFNSKGFVTNKSYKELLKRLVQLVCLTCIITFKYSKAKKDIRENYLRISNISFWSKYLHI